VGYVKVYYQRPDINTFILNADRQHFDRAMECIVNSVPTSELVDVLLHFNPWEIESGPKFQLEIFPRTPSFLRWLKSQASHEPSSFLIIIRLHCSHTNLARRTNPVVNLLNYVGFSSATLTNGSSKRSEKCRRPIGPFYLQPYVSIPHLPINPSQE
jgi:hypothetical protein